jgi:hypothetical protein
MNSLRRRLAAAEAHERHHARHHLGPYHRRSGAHGRFRWHECAERHRLITSPCSVLWLQDTVARAKPSSSRHVRAGLSKNRHFVSPAGITSAVEGVSDESSAGGAFVLSAGALILSPGGAVVERQSSHAMLAKSSNAVAPGQRHLSAS